MRDGDPEESRLREVAELMWRTAAVHRARASRLAMSGEPGGELQVRAERGLAKVAAEHAMAFQELANVVEARSSAAGRPRTSPEWSAAMNRSFAALRRAEAHHHRAAAVPAHDEPHR
ncbi:hypothetical protein Amsp01_087960 [Amycolatopsis sp. NBRC 101858]|uniref:hypothetical protein n=1 Tax=Amycolatopsis sp. NBRC 101858 TaxID=3032200 RepID=UPI0024A5A02C|nr:hypothetical protein [Amycolatopsis sp. NBRC 101858]GLY42773.1 hypothetical protein Amsp01_087960 [Amycolatopsis sp. NBRC 101858]